LDIAIHLLLPLPSPFAYSQRPSHQGFAASRASSIAAKVSDSIIADDTVDVVVDDESADITAVLADSMPSTIRATAAQAPPLPLPSLAAAAATAIEAEVDALLE
jgi:hypothetical protein